MLRSRRPCTCCSLVTGCFWVPDFYAWLPQRLRQCPACRHGFMTLLFLLCKIVSPATPGSTCQTNIGRCSGLLPAQHQPGGGSARSPPLAPPLGAAAWHRHAAVAHQPGHPHAAGSRCACAAMHAERRLCQLIQSASGAESARWRHAVHGTFARGSAPPPSRGPSFQSRCLSAPYHPLPPVSSTTHLRWVYTQGAGAAAGRKLAPAPPRAAGRRRGCLAPCCCPWSLLAPACAARRRCAGSRRRCCTFRLPRPLLTDPAPRCCSHHEVWQVEHGHDCG